MIKISIDALIKITEAFQPTTNLYPGTSPSPPKKKYIFLSVYNYKCCICINLKDFITVRLLYLDQIYLKCLPTAWDLYTLPKNQLSKVMVDKN